VRYSILYDNGTIVRVDLGCRLLLGFLVLGVVHAKEVIIWLRAKIVGVKITNNIICKSTTKEAFCEYNFK
jgi:hypothetical protein